MSVYVEHYPLELVDEPTLASRVIMDVPALEELAESVKTKGVLEPLLVVLTPADGQVLPYPEKPSTYEVYQHDKGRVRVMAGHRRLLAARMAYLADVPCLVHAPGEKDEDMVMLEENMCRQDVTAAEQGYWILSVVEQRGYSMPQLMKIFRRSEAWINERVELVRTDAEVSAAVAERRITFAVAKQIMRVKDEEHRKFYLREAIRLDLSAASLSYMVDNYKRDQERQTTFKPAAGPGSELGAPASEPSGPHCVLCGLRDASQNMVQVLAHYYHLNPIKKLLRDAGVEWYESPR